MDIEEAIKSIAENETITGFTAQMVIKDKKQLPDFVQMIHDQYHRDGNKDNLIELYGEEVIQTILDHVKVINAQAESICMSKCIEEDLNESDTNIN